jgi:hypothetical protein
LRKKSRSTVSSPIFSYSLASRASSATPVSEAPTLAFGKQRPNPVNDRFLPGMDLAGMDAVAARQLRHRAVLANRRQRYLRLEINPVLFANIRHL